MSGSGWYFAYGANMSTSMLVSRRKMAPLSSEAALLDGYRLEFTTPGLPLVEPVFANISADCDGVVHGVLHRLPHRDLARLDLDESPAYDHLEVQVTGTEVGRVSAIAYHSSRRTLGRKPSRRYLELVCRGAAEFGLPAAYQAELAAHPARHIPLLSPLTAALWHVIMPLRRRLKSSCRPGTA